MTKPLNDELSVVQSLVPATRTADANGSSADLEGHHAAMAVIDVGAYTDGTHTFEVQESDDDSTWSAVADGDLEGTEPVVDAAGDANTVHEIGYRGTAKFIRVVVTATGTTSGADYGASIVRGLPRKTAA